MLLYVCYQYLIASFRFLNLCLLFLYTIDMLEPMDNVTYYMTNKPEYDLILLSFYFRCSVVLRIIFIVFIIYYQQVMKYHK